MARETEIKLELTAADAALLEQRLGPVRQVIEQRNYYLDTEAGDLRKEHYGLRLRHEILQPSAPRTGPATERHVLTFKGPARRAGAAHHRLEQEVAVSQQQALQILATGLDPAVVGLGELTAVAARLEIGRVTCLGLVANERRILDAPGNLRLELDATRFPDGSVEFELEVECPGGDAAAPEAALRGIFAALELPWRPSRGGKYARFLARRRP